MPKRFSNTMILFLEEKILGGVLQPGDRLPTETELERTFGISRTVVREGLQALKSRGMIESRRGSGTYVARPSRELIGDSLSLYASLQPDGKRYLELMDLRILVETEAARMVASGSTPIARISAHLDAMERNLGNPSGFADADIAFHLSIIKASGHSLFYAVAEGLLSAPALSFARSTHRIDSSRAYQVFAEHQVIHKALENRDPGSAARAMRSHLRRSRQNLVNRLKLS
jgi:GntR family transcriptional repressor for pyruvate dehydrogenase complex